MSASTIGGIIAFGVVAWLLIIAISSYIMGSKGQSVLKGFFLGMVFNIFGIIVAIFYKTTDTQLEREMYNRGKISVNEYTRTISIEKTKEDQ